MNSAVAEDRSFVATSIPGDSSIAASADDYGQDALDDASAGPKHKNHARPQRRTAPIIDPQLRKERREMWQKRNDSEGVGNVGWLFGNWGHMPKTNRCAMALR